MKKIAAFLVLFLVVGISQISAQDFMDIAPSGSANVDTHSTTFPYNTLFNFHYSGIPGINGGTVGAMYFNDLYYLNKWNAPDYLYRYTGGWAGPTTRQDSIPYYGQIRDLTTDGQFLYGGRAAAVIYKMDGNGALLSSINIPGGVARAIAYTPDENGFFCSNFSDDIKLYSMTGTLIRTLTGTAALASKYGMAYSNFDGPKLWVWGQGTNADPYNKLWIVNPQTGATIQTYQFGPLPVPAGATSPSGISGGAEICVINGWYVLLLNYQNYALTGHALVPVPVELSSFTANSMGGNVQINWVTATETNNQGFEVYRGTEKIAFIHGAGTTSEKMSYSYLDENVASGNYSYRLIQIDFDGTRKEVGSVEVEVNSITDFALFQNYPNPFNPNTTISYQIRNNSFVTLKVYNSLGVEVAAVVNEHQPAGIYNIDFNGQNLSSGVYYYKLTAGNFNDTKKFILIK